MPKRRTLDETRALLLDTGTSMLDEAGITVSLGGITMIDVCRAAGLSTSGSAYKIWDSQDAFRADLLEHLVALTDADPEFINHLIDITRAQRDELPELSELLRSLAADPEGWAAGGPGYGVFAALLLAARHDPVLDRRIHDLDMSLFESLSRLYALIGEIYGLQWAPPYDEMHLAISLSALAEGIATRATIIHDVIDIELLRPTGPDGQERPWTIYGACVDAVVAAFTTEVPGANRTRHSETETTATIEGPTPVSPDPVEPENPTSHGRSRRRSLEQTRTLLLETGGKLLVDSGLNVTLGDLDLLDVCRRAGMTSTGSVYKIWETREAFRIDLIRHYLAKSLNTDQNPFQVADLLQAARDSELTLSETIRTISAAWLDAGVAPPDSVVLAVGLAARHDEALAVKLHETEEASLTASTEVFDAAIRFYGRSWKPPFDGRIFALALDALLQGFTIRLMSTPELVPDNLMRPTGTGGAEVPWHLFACTAEAIVMAFTRPDDASPSDPH